MIAFIALCAIFSILAMRSLYTAKDTGKESTRLPFIWGVLPLVEPH
jgi:hypothetical protein